MDCMQDGTVTFIVLSVRFVFHIFQYLYENCSLHISCMTATQKSTATFTIPGYSLLSQTPDRSVLTKTLNIPLLPILGVYSSTLNLMSDHYILYTFHLYRALYSS